MSGDKMSSLRAQAVAQVSQHLADKQAAEKQEKGIRVLNWRISFSKA